MSAYLVVRDGRLSMVGKLHQSAQVGAQVWLASNQQHFSVGTEFLNFPFPLWRKTKTSITNAFSNVTFDMTGSHMISPAHTVLPVQRLLPPLPGAPAAWTTCKKSHISSLTTMNALWSLAVLWGLFFLNLNAKRLGAGWPGGSSWPPSKEKLFCLLCQSLPVRTGPLD